MTDDERRETAGRIAAAGQDSAWVHERIGVLERQARELERQTRQQWAIIGRMGERIGVLEAGDCGVTGTGADDAVVLAPAPGTPMGAARVTWHPGGTEQQTREEWAMLAGDERVSPVRWIYHLGQIGFTGAYDEVIGFVVVADDPEVARDLASGQAGDEGAATWLAPKLSSCALIGEAARGLPAAVIMRDGK